MAVLGPGQLGYRQQRRNSLAAPRWHAGSGSFGDGKQGGESGRRRDGGGGAAWPPHDWELERLEETRCGGGAAAAMELPLASAMASLTEREGKNGREWRGGASPLLEHGKETSWRPCKQRRRHTTCSA